MSTYHPDRWVIVKISSGDATYKKVFSGSYGGYGGSDTWKMSSSIEEITEDKDSYTANCSSGSTYILYKQAYGMSGYMCSVYNGLHEDIDKTNFTIEIVGEYAYKG